MLCKLLTRNCLFYDLPSRTDTTDINGRSARNIRGERTRGRGAQGSTRGGRDRTCVQSVGLFSEGIGITPSKRGQSRSSYSDAAAAQPRRPTLLKTSQRVDDNAEKRSLMEFLNEEDTESNPLENVATEEDFLAPIVLSQGERIYVRII